MAVFTRSRRTIVKSYGRDSLLFWLNPLIAAIQASLGLRVGVRSEAEVLDAMEKDALKMEQRGYRVQTADRYELPLLFGRGQAASYYKVTYELARAPAGDPDLPSQPAPH
jgi:hypothetical protein